MNFEDVEDLLFGDPGSQQAFDDLWDDDSDDFDDDEMLDVAGNTHDLDHEDLLDPLALTTADSTQLPSSPTLIPELEPIVLQHNDRAQPTDVSKMMPHNRCLGCPVVRSKC